MNLLVAAAATAALALAPTPHQPPVPPDPPAASAPTPRGPASVAQLSATPHTALAPCEEDPSWLCGTVTVPVDRSQPTGRTLGLAVSVLPHSDPASTATDALFSTDGGPGISNLAPGSRGFQQYLAGDLNQERDLVLVNHRGTGETAIVCPRLQRVLYAGGADPDEVVRQIGSCGGRLGEDADRYGSGDVALDWEDVRQALGYEQISLYGLSYGASFVSAFATRFPEHVRATVIDAGVPTTDPGHEWTWGRSVAATFGPVISRHCRRAPACLTANPHPNRALARLADLVRREPVRGRVEVPGVGLQTVVVDEPALLDMVGDILNQGELTAVSASLENGDKAPLLRLGADVLRNSVGDPGDPHEDSAGDNVAANCNDDDFVWDRTDPIPVRRAKYQAALEAMGPRAFAPFSPQAWSDYFLTAYCLRWPAPDRFTPAVEPGATVAGVPTLIMSGDLDTVVPTGTTGELLRVFPDAMLLPVAGAAHPSAGWSGCAQEAFHEFVRTLASTARCKAAAFRLATTSSFPAHVRDAVPATPEAGDAATVFDHRLATTLVQTLRDARTRTFREPDATGTITGLRGGTAAFDFGSADDHATWQLDGLSFARGLRVTGTMTLTYADETLSFDVTTSGPHDRTGDLTGSGQFGFGPPFSDFHVTGTLAGRTLAVAVPAN